MDEKFIKFASDLLGTSVSVALEANSIGAIPAAAIAFIFKSGAQACMQKIYNDFEQRSLSAMQVTRVEQVLHFAQKAYVEIMEKQDWNLNHPESVDYVTAHLEACEHTVINAINESQSKKIPFEGYLFATKYSSVNMDFEDFHMMANLLFKMTWREMVLVHLFNKGWTENIEKLYITNPAACVEIYDLVTWGLVKPEAGWIIENNSAPILLSNITITDFGSSFASALQTDKISAMDLKKIVDSLGLKNMEQNIRVNRSNNIVPSLLSAEVIAEDDCDEEEIIQVIKGSLNK